MLPPRDPRTARLAMVCGAAGAVLVIVTSLLGGDGPAVLVAIAWALVPYALLVAAGWSTARGSAVLGAGLSALAVELGIRLAVFAFPRGSTAAIALVFSPVFIAVVAMPIGAVGGMLAGWGGATRHPWLRASAIAASAVALGLTVLGLARPDLFPTTVYTRRQALERIGPPGVRTGRDRFVRTVVDPENRWRQTGEFDGQPGDELALIGYERIDLLDPETLAVRGVLPLAGDSRRWNWFSHLIRLEGQPRIAETGGGFQETQVRTLDGPILWRYRPDPALPPSSLVPGDLEPDGSVEFYAATGEALVRLDGDGRPVWRQPLTNGAVVATAPRTPTTAAWVVTVGQDQMLGVWDETGRRAARLPLHGAAVVGVVEWPVDRTLVVARDEAVRGLRLDGSTAWEWTVGDMQVTQVAVLRESADGPASLVLAAAAPRDTGRWRVQIVSPERQLAYDEVLDQPAALLTARGASGTARLFVSGRTLDALRLASLR